MSEKSATARLRHIRNLLQQWIDKQGHDKCWFYPEIFLEIADAAGIDPKQAEGMHTVPLADFQAGCCRYQQELYGGDTPTLTQAWSPDGKQQKGEMP